MKVSCLYSPFARRSAGSLLVLAAAAFLSGCTTPSEAVAPRSNISRQHALELASQAANLVGGRVFTIAPTGSMKPTLDENSVVAVEVVPFADLRRGDIVIYRNASGLPIVHRLFQHSDGRWLVLGDNNGSVDREAVTAENLLGRVCAIFYARSGPAGEADTALAGR